jgi:radical SAM superfamily enzyme YgiQ (UPF0313 family)
VQDFYPTPGTLSTAMYYTGRNPLTSKPVEVATTGEEKAMQRALLQFNQKRNWPKIRAALKKAGRTDLIGRGGDSLVPPEQVRKKKNADTAEPKKSAKRR